MVLYLELKGTPKERGKQQGEILKKKIEDALDFVFSSKLFKGMMPKYLPSKAILYSLGKFAQSKIQKPIMKHFPHHYEKMIAISEGAQIPQYMQFLVHFIEIINMMPGLIYNVDPNKINYSCSQLFALKEVTDDNNDYFARNYDFPTILQPFQMVRKEIPDDGYTNLNLSQFPWAPSHIGVNEKGLAAGYNNGRSWRKDINDFQIRGVPSTFLIQEVLEKASNVDEAIEIITQFPARTIGGHFGLLDETGNACLIETTASRFAIRRPKHGTLAHTNHYIELTDANLPESTRFKVEGLDIHPQSSPRVRLKRIEQLLEDSKGKLNKNQIIKILSDHEHEPDDFTVCTHGESSTLATTVIVPKNREFWTTDNLPCKSEFEHFKI